MPKFPRVSKEQTKEYVDGVVKTIRLSKSLLEHVVEREPAKIFKKLNSALPKLIAKLERDLVKLERKPTEKS